MHWARRLIDLKVAALRWPRARARTRLQAPVDPAMVEPGAVGAVLAEPTGRDIEHRLEELKDVVWELRESEARYRDLLDTQDNVIVRRDGQGRLTYVNGAFCRMFGVGQADVLGRGWHPVIHGQERMAGAAGAGQRRYALLVDTAQGQRWLAFEEHGVPVPNADGAGGKTVDDHEIQIVGTDVTEARAFQAELASARDQAQSADRAKSRFLAAMSHEIRTPMNGILGMAGLLADTELSAEQRTYLDAVDQSARTLRLLIDEILDFSKIEAGKLVLAAAPFALDACVQSTVELLAPSAHEKGLEIAWTIDPQLPSCHVGDAARVRQILLNLIGNAVKFTDLGGVLVGVTCEAAPGGDTRIALRVEDTGIGMSSAAKDRLFADFGQADDENALRRGGTGLGLAISRRLAQAMGGDITVESVPGQGSVFTVRLALTADAAARPLIPMVERSADAGSVLLAFDKPIERKALAAGLRAIGLEVIEAGELAAADAIAAAAKTTRPVAFVVRDPSADPVFSERLLACARGCTPGRPVRGLLIIDSMSRPSLKQFRAAGFGSYLVRPVRPLTLLARFGIEGAGMAPAARTDIEGSGTTAAPASSAARHVLLAEDNAINALLANRMLANAGCTVEHVTDGELALAAARASLQPGARRFDLILMDVHMPRLDGLAAAAAIRAMAEADAGRGGVSALPPMMALTANAFPEDRARCLAAGFDDYLSKPFHKSELLALLERWDRRRPDEGGGGGAAA